MVILGTQYAGEMKKGVFTVMHYLMPKQGILSLHSGCNEGKGGDVTLFFGLSGAQPRPADSARPLPLGLLAAACAAARAGCAHMRARDGERQRAVRQTEARPHAQARARPRCRRTPSGR